MKKIKSASLLAAGLMLAFPYEAVPALTRVGAAGGVSGQVLAMAPESGEGVQAKVGRILSSGKTVYHNDKISTDAKGRLQVMLLDETVFTIGPNSEMYIDEFVYDPADAEKNKVTARVSKGAFRFVTGKIAAKEPSSMKVKLPVGTIGIRGTIAGGYIGPMGTLVALLGPGANNNAGEKPGAISVDAANAQVITSPNMGVNIDANSGEVSSPAPLTLAQQQMLDTTPPPPLDPTGGDGQGTAPPPSSQGAPQPSNAPPSNSPEPEGEGESPSNAAGAPDAATQTEGAAANVTTQDLNAFQTEVNTASQEAATSSILDGTAKWVDVQTGGRQGTGYYSGGGSYTCDLGISCSLSPGSGTASFMIDINFDSKTLGGGSSSVSLFGGGPLAGQSTTISAFSYAGLSGDASFTLGANAQNSMFSDTGITLVNQGGTAAHHADMTLRYNNGLNGTSPDLATVSGTFY